ncbi:MAG: hypothetical protein P4N60_20275 [Verrucomicrobiae bacterium]|nr:hypothetical protein [Verrucomicrobiae bacterium]
MKESLVDILGSLLSFAVTNGKSTRQGINVPSAKAVSDALAGIFANSVCFCT